MQIYQWFAGSPQEVFILKIQNDENKYPPTASGVFLCGAILESGFFVALAFPDLFGILVGFIFGTVPFVAFIPLGGIDVLAFDAFAVIISHDGGSFLFVIIGGICITVFMQPFNHFIQPSAPQVIKPCSFAKPTYQCWANGIVQFDEDSTAKTFC